MLCHLPCRFNVSTLYSERIQRRGQGVKNNLGKEKTIKLVFQTMQEHGKPNIPALELPLIDSPPENPGGHKGRFVRASHDVCSRPKRYVVSEQVHAKHSSLPDELVC